MKSQTKVLLAALQSYITSGLSSCSAGLDDAKMMLLAHCEEILKPAKSKGWQKALSVTQERVKFSQDP